LESCLNVSKKKQLFDVFRTKQEVSISCLSIDRESRCTIETFFKGSHRVQYTYKTSPASAFWFAFFERVLGGVGGGDSRISFLQGGLVGSEVAQDRFSSGEVGGSEIAGLSPVFYYVAIF
jgi:hypothetical protein